MQVTTGRGGDFTTIASDFCPFIRNPAPDCHCYRLGNPEVSSLMYFCGHNYKYCDIYRRRMQGRDTPRDAAAD